MSFGHNVMNKPSSNDVKSGDKGFGMTVTIHNRSTTVSFGPSINNVCVRELQINISKVNPVTHPHSCFINQTGADVRF